MYNKEVYITTNYEFQYSEFILIKFYMIWTVNKYKLHSYSTSVLLVHLNCIHI